MVYIHKSFALVDYFVFGLMLIVSAGIGVFFACTGGKQRTTKEWLTGNKQLAWVPTSLSLLASFISAITLLGTPAETYSVNTMYLYLCLSYLFVIPISAHVFMPVYRCLNITSVYEYMELRFSRLLRTVSCVIAIFSMTIYMSIVLYAPALALSAVTGVSLAFSILACGSVCTFYTVIGGMKAVIWADAVQTLIMVCGMLIIIVVGSLRVGGSEYIIDAAVAGNKMVLDDFTLDPRTRHSGFTMIFGGIATWSSIYAVNQAQVQRYVSVRTKAGAFKALYLNMPGLAIMMLVSGACGIIAYGRYALCDPIQAQHISKSDQILPFFVVDVFHDIPGFAGLFVSAIMSGALSTVSSGVNAIAGIVVNDLFIFYINPDEIEAMYSSTNFAKITKFIAIVFGFISIGLAFLAGQFGSVLQVALSLFGVLNGPILGTVALGILTRRARSKSALVGLLLSTSFTIWLMMGALFSGYQQERPAMLTVGCENATLDDGSFQLQQPEIAVPPEIRLLYLKGNLSMTSPIPATDTSEWNFLQNSLYRISYMWYGTIGCLLSFILGYLGSLCETTEKEKTNQRLFFNLRRAFSLSDDVYAVVRLAKLNEDAL